MAESDEVREYYTQRNKLILLEARLHGAFCKITGNAYWDSSGACDIHPAIVHPEWTNIKDRIYPILMIWQIAYMVYPFRDDWLSHNPFSYNSYFMKRLQVMYEIVDCIECGYIKNYQLPPEISNVSQLETASFDYKVRIKVHFDDLATAIKSGGFGFWNSRWIRLWVAHSTRARKPKLPFSLPPEPVHIQGVFNETAFFREIDGKPFKLHEVHAPDSTGIKQIYVDSLLLWQEKYRSRNIHPVFEDQIEWIEKNLDTKTVIEVQPIYMAGDPRPPTYKLGEKPQPNTTIDLQAIQPITNESTTNTLEEIIAGKCPVLADQSNIIERKKPFKPQLSKLLNDASVKPLQQKRESTNDRYAYYLKIYQQVVAEMGAGSRKGVLIAEAIQRAGCSEKTMRKAIQANK